MTQTVKGNGYYVRPVSIMQAFKFNNIWRILNADVMVTQIYLIYYHDDQIN